MANSVRINGLDRLTAIMDQFEKNTGIKLEDAVRLYGLNMYRGLILRSPVDTGTFRGAWNLEINKNVDGALFQVVITNNVPYAEPLVVGSPVGGKPWPSAGPKTVRRGGRIFSAQSPENMAEAVFAEVRPQDLAEEVAKAITEVLSGQ